MTIIQKMHLIQKLMNEVKDETREVALNIKDIDEPLYRMLSEGFADNVNDISKNYASRIESWEKQLEYAYELINKKNK